MMKYMQNKTFGRPSKNSDETKKTEKQQDNCKAFCIINNRKNVRNLKLYLLQRQRQNFRCVVSFNLTQTIFEGSIDMQKSVNKMA